MILFRLNKQFFAYVVACTLLCTIVRSQPVHGRIVDATHSRPVAYALISNADRSYGVTADAEGKFTADKRLLSGSEKVHVSAPGYNTAYISIAQNKLNEIGMVKGLHPDKSQTIVTRKKRQPKKYGAFDVKSPSLFTGAYEGSNFEMALYLPNPNAQTGKIEGVSLLLAKTGIFDAPVRIQFYEENNGIPGNIITNEDIVVKGFKPNDWNDFALDSYNIPFPANGCFVSVEWLNMNNSAHTYPLQRERESRGIGPTIRLTDDKPNAMLYSRKNQGEWEKVKKIYWDSIKMANVSPVIGVVVSH